MRLGKAGAAGSALIALALVLAPATASTNQQQKAKKQKSSQVARVVGGFTPAVADPRLAAEFARRGFAGNSFRFTPSAVSTDRRKAVTVAVRARAQTPAQALRVADARSSQVTAITPVAYNLGVSVGWKRFALLGDVAKVEGGVMAGRRESAEVGVSYSARKFTGQVTVGADRTEDTPRIIPDETGYSLDVGGSYAIARNVSVTGGVRYRIERERLESLADERRDSQAIYIGTAFRF